MLLLSFISFVIWTLIVSNSTPHAEFANGVIHLLLVLAVLFFIIFLVDLLLPVFTSGRQTSLFGRREVCNRNDHPLTDVHGPARSNIDRENSNRPGTVVV